MDRREDQLWQLRAATELPRAVGWTALPLEEERATRPARTATDGHGVL